MFIVNLLKQEEIQMQDMFETWFIAQFGQDQAHMLELDADGYYRIEGINGMWIGFNAGVELSK